jgi:isopropylmalate/homocitrate/citramalate synthase
MADDATPDHIRIYDTTLRDGAQMPGVAFTPRQQLDIATALDELGLDEIEIGFAASGPRHRADMAAITRLDLRATMLSLARPLRPDIDAALETGVDGVIIFTALSDLHLRHKLRLEYQEALDQACDAAEYARGHGLFVQVSLEDGTRTAPDRLVASAKCLVDAGAGRIGLADTVGTASPATMATLVERLTGDLDVPIAVHCHDDFGLATANTLAAVEHGARVISTTMTGIGERSGNAATEQCVLALTVLHGRATSLRLDRLLEVCQLVERCSGVPIRANSPVVGANSFRHESGIHVAAMLREPNCYEPYDPVLVGARRSYALGKTSGRAALLHLAGPIGRDLDDTTCQRVLDEVKTYAEQRRTIDAELVAEIIERSVS